MQNLTITINDTIGSNVTLILKMIEVTIWLQKPPLITKKITIGGIEEILEYLKHIITGVNTRGLY